MYMGELHNKLEALTFTTVKYIHPTLTAADVFPSMVEDFLGFDRTRLDHDDNEEAMENLFSVYIKEIWLSELAPPATLDTGAVVDALLHGRTEEARSCLGTVYTPHMVADVLRQITNLLAATRYLLGDNFRNHCEAPLSLELIIEVHRLIGAGDPGEFRTRIVHAIGSGVCYTPPKKIMPRLSTLVTFVNDHLQKCASLPLGVERSRRQFFLGVLFFSEFLLIHPFRDGNGRTARLLTNHLLRETTFVPFSLYYKSKDLYLQVLEERSDGRMAPPSALAFYMLICARKTHEDFLGMMED